MRKINENQISNIFRLSSILYSEDNYTFSPRQLHQKVIENALFEMNIDEFTNLLNLSEFIEECYNFLFTDDEIWEIVSLPKLQNNTFIVYEAEKERYVNLSASRKQTIANKVTPPNINLFIEEFTAINNLPLKNTRDIIYRFLYSVFTSNAENFKRLINNSEIQFPQVDNSFDDDEKHIINEFLNWENLSKDKTIFNVASSALEYCLLTNNNKTSITFESLRNKSFYLDTNIIFRALGINGDLRKRRTLSILNKFKDVGETLHISHITEQEFKNSVHFHCQIIAKYNNPAINSELFDQVADTHKDFYNSYQRWRSNKINCSVEMFEANLNVLFEEFLTAFQISIETFAPYDKTIDKIQLTLDEYKEGILKYKRDRYANKAKHDAENILWIEYKRNNEPSSIFESKFFLLSSDHRLQNWDYNRNNLVPVVFLPSQWLSITLRFIGRTNDDFSSFVSFLNLPYNERILDNEQIMAVLSGISEYTADYDMQKKVYFKFIESKITKELDLSKSDSTYLHSEAKEFAKSEIEKEFVKSETLREIEKKKFEEEKIRLSGIIADQQEKNKELSIHIEKLESDGTKQKDENKRLSSEIISLKNSLLKLNRIKKLLIWGAALFFMIILTTLSFIFQEWEHNYIAKLLDYFEELGGIRSEIVSCGFVALLSFVFYKFKKNYNDLREN